MKGKKEQNETAAVPTKSEMDVLQVLWKHGASTVRFVHETLNEKKAAKEAVQYTSTLKLMQVMTEKGMLLRDDTNMKHVYSAALEEKKTKGTLLSRFVDNMYDGSVSGLMTALLGNDKTSPRELQAIEEMLKKLDKMK